MKQTTELNWFEVINNDEDGADWWKFDNYEEAKSFYDEKIRDGEEVTLMKPDKDWDEENKSYETILAWDD